jgi:hypothetical protein
MARKRSEIDPDEMKAPQLMDCALIALLYIGGDARKEPIIERVGEMLKDQLKPCDKRPMYHRPSPDGWQLAPVGYTGKTTPIWEVKTSYSFKLAVLEGLVTAHDGAVLLTPEGLKYVAQLTEKGN